VSRLTLATILMVAWGMVNGFAVPENHSAPASAPVSVGAIRWDAWHGPASDVGLMVEKTLAPAHWHYRIPFYGRVIAKDAVEIRGDTRDVMDREILYAHEAGLDYWAFVVYPEEHALSRGLQLYLSSSLKDRIGFCLILQGGWEGRGGQAAWEKKANRYVNLLRDPMYQKTPQGRPLIYLYSVEGLVGTDRFDSWEEARAAFDRFRDMVRREGLPDPYIVAQGWSPEILAQQADTLGLDAIGAYASNGGGRAAPYRELAAHTENWWDAFAATGRQVVPLATAGWDMRPRIETPVPWVKDGDIEQYYALPTPEELAGHVAKAVAWCQNHPDAAPARTVLIYAWNEFDEGGWICPTLNEGTARLDALRNALMRGKRDEGKGSSAGLR